MGKRCTSITYKDNPKYLRANTKRHATHKRKCMNGIKLQNFKRYVYACVHCIAFEKRRVVIYAVASIVINV